MPALFPKVNLIIFGYGYQWKEEYKPRRNHGDYELAFPADNLGLHALARVLADAGHDCTTTLSTSVIWIDERWHAVAWDVCIPNSKLRSNADLS
jgi:hypothetical protein